ncbi:MAG: hypothetical protein R3233_03760, partial [Xanthomonadales bacterium]|nr:hypothetical protein [Xanthomonadales bacterium]
VGNVNGDSADVDVFITGGGRWGAGFDPALVQERQWGSGTFRVDSCHSMHMSLVPNAESRALGYSDLEYGLVRLTTPAMPCPIEAVD